MEQLNKLFRNKNFRNLFFGIVFFIVIINFPFLLLFVTPLLIIASAYDQHVQNKKVANKKIVDNEQGYVDPDLQELKQISQDLKDLKFDKDYSKLKKITERIPSLIKDVRTPKTFFEVAGDLITKTDLYYCKGLYKPEEIEDEYAFLIEEFHNAKEVCDQFFDGNEYIKVWLIYRTLLQKQVPEKEINQIFPEMISKMKDIRDQKWKDVAWAYHIADEVEKVTGKDSCNKERYKKQEEFFAKDNSKERITANQSYKLKNDFKLLLEFDQKELAEKNQGITKNFLESFDPKNFAGKPKKIKSKICWKLEDAIQFAKLVQNKYSELPNLNAYGAVNELRKKNLQYAGLVRTKDFYEASFDKKFVENIQDIERLSDFYQYEMFDEDPLQTAIDNKDIERIMFYSLIQIPKQTILEAVKVSENDPKKRAPYFSIIFTHMKMFLLILEELEIYNHEEQAIQSWIMNKIMDPLDKGNAFLDFGKENKKGTDYDQKFREELWLPLYHLLFLELCNPKGLVGDIDKVFQLFDSVSVSVLTNYFVGNPEEGYMTMKPMLDALKEEKR